VSATVEQPKTSVDEPAEPAATPTDAPSALERVRAVPENPHAFRGYGPLLALIVFVLLSVVLAPTVAPEHVVLEPSGSTTTVTTAVQP
jgi:hypothetical protein